MLKLRPPKSPSGFLFRIRENNVLSAELIKRHIKRYMKPRGARMAWEDGAVVTTDQGMGERKEEKMYEEEQHLFARYSIIKG